MPDAPHQQTEKGEELVLSSRLLQPMLRFFEDRYGREEMLALVAELGTDLATLEDPEQWLSANLVRRFNHLMVERTGDPMITYVAGLELLTPRGMGPAYHLVRAGGSPRKVYESLPQVTPQLSRITTWEIPKVTDRSAVARFRIVEGQEDDPLFCLNRQGVLTAVPTIFDRAPAAITHPVCIHDGGPYCEYHVEWMPANQLLRLLVLALIPTCLVVGVLAVLGVLSPAAWSILAGLGAATLGVSLFVVRRRIRDVLRVSQEQLVDLRTLIQSNERRVRELTMLAKADELTRRQLRVSTLIDTALQQITTTLGYDRAFFMQVDPARGELGATRSVGYGAEVSAALDTLTVRLDPPSSDRRLFTNIVRQGKGVLIRDVDEFRSQLNPQNRALVDQLGTRSFIAVPVAASAGELLGLLVVDHPNPDLRLSERDVRLMEQLGHLLGLALGNAQMVERLRRQRRQLQNALLQNQKLSQYLPRPVVDRIREDPDEALRLGGQRMKAAVLFSDIVGFTPWSERREPEVVVTVLNRYFAMMDELIQAAGGIVDKRIGDGLMVVFPPAPDEQAPGVREESPARRALACATRMQQALREPCARPGEEERVVFDVRIGVAFGEVVAGNMGSSYRLEYTVIGDVVNVAARMESECPPGSVFTTAATVAAAGPGSFVVRERGQRKVKGRVERVETFEVLGMTDGQDLERPR